VDRTDDQLLTLFNRLKKHHNDGWPVADGAGNNGVKQNWLKHKNLAAGGRPIKAKDGCIL
jgi:hypothetical protein